MQFPQCGKFKLYFPHCGIYNKVHSIMWKLSLFLPQNYFNYLTVEVLLAYIVCAIFYSIYFAHCGIILLPVLWKVSNHSLHAVDSLHCNFHNVENSNCTYHIEENITRCFPHWRNYHNFLPKIIYTFIV